MTLRYRRKPNPTEARTIARQKYEFYTNLVVGAIYQFPASTTAEEVFTLSTYLSALKKCLDHHPFLSALVVRPDGNEAVFQIAESIDLGHHFLVHDRQASATEDVQIGRVIERLSNDPNLTFFDSLAERPGWRIDIVPLGSRGPYERAWIGFSYSHCIGDGRSGMIFQELFFSALAESLRTSSVDSVPVYEPKEVELEALPKLPISIRYLLGPALGHYLPKFLSKWLGLKASTSGSDDGTWTGPPTFINDSGVVPRATTAVEVYTVGKALLMEVLQACRAHDAKLTSLLNVLLAKSISRNLQNYTTVEHDKDNFIAAIPTDLRRIANVSEKTIGNFSSVAYSRHTIDRSLTTECEAFVTSNMWSAASNNSKHLMKQTSTLTDQPIGLLSWISNLDSWMRDQIGKQRDCSWQLSNLMKFNGGLSQSTGDVLNVEKAYFCQPANAVGNPLDFNTVSLAGGDLVICVGWQVGSVGLTANRGPNTEDIEREFVSRVLINLTAYLEAATR